eukprot:scaffold243134_cov26-Tisochrysis_lutea.AAC.1
MCVAFQLIIQLCLGDPASFKAARDYVCGISADHTATSRAQGHWYLRHRLAEASGAVLASLCKGA